MICFAILAHDNEVVLADQIRNIRRTNPDSQVVFYNGGLNSDLGKGLEVHVCPLSHPLQRGRLGPFLIDVMYWLEESQVKYDYLVCLDSDVMFVRGGFERLLDRLLVGYDCMGINMGVQHSKDEVPHWYPGQTMWAEWERWQSFFGTDGFAGCLNSMQVYRHGIVQKIVEQTNRNLLDQLMADTDVYALEEMLCPTLAMRAGAKHRPYPYEIAQYVRLGEPYTKAELSAVLRDPYAYFIHPIQRSDSDPARDWLRSIERERPDTPRSLTIVWAAYQGGVETAVSNRLRQLNVFGSSHHVYFYHDGTGHRLFEDVPHHISKYADDLIQYVHQNKFRVLTFVNTLYNLESIAETGFDGVCLFEFHGFAQPIMEELNRINEHRDGGLIRGVVVPGHYVAAIARSALWKRPDVEIFVAANTVDTRLFFHRTVDKTALSEMGIPDHVRDRRVIGWAGRLEPHKNWRLLLETFSELLKTRPKLSLLIAGDVAHSPELNEFMTEVQRKNLTHRLRLLPNLSHESMSLFYSFIADSGGVLLSTSYTEGYPYHVLEAQACECPVVCTNAGGSIEAVTHGATGYTYVYDSREAAYWIETMFENKALRKQLVRQALEKVFTVNDMEQNVTSYGNWLRHLVKQGTGAND